MSSSAIRVDGLGKRYRIRPRERYRLLSERMSRAFRRRPAESKRSDRSESIWALKDVTFAIEPGEVVGVIGRNGAGKSTLLKILSRITEPTEGRAVVRGRIGSLLEVGTGFHPELTGRENIFLNGAILGMKKTDIARRFDEIVAFAEVEKFVDTPVKHYSSGMYVRLAFGVAAHLEPEILLVDEVLAVGDAAFQKKCLGRMGEVGRQGRTVIFVSHQLVAVQSLCRRAIHLDHGGVVDDGPAARTVTKYLGNIADGVQRHEELFADPASAPGDERVRLRRVAVRRGAAASEPLTMDSPFVIEVDFWNLAVDSRLHVTLHLYTEQGVIAFTTGSSADLEWYGKPMPTGLFQSVCHVPGNLLNSGWHRLVVLVVRDGSSVILNHESTVSFNVLDVSARREGWLGREPGVVQPLLTWTTQYVDAAVAAPV